jgi:hypothetical protein
MITAFLLIAKSFISNAISILTKLIEFAIKHWQLVLFSALIITCFILYSKLNSVQFEYDQHLISDMKAAEDRRAENEKKEYRHQIAIEEAHAESVILIEKFNLDRKRYTKELKDLYDAKTNSTYRLNSYADWMRLEQERKATAGLPDTEANTSSHSEGWRECHAAYFTLEQACRITTIDFNELRKWADAACQTVECK